MKKIFCFILLGFLFLIPKEVFAKIYYVGYESTGYLYTSNSSLISEISGNSGEWRYQPNVTTIIDGNGIKSGIFTTKLMNINGINASSSYNLYGSFTISKKNEACSTLPCSSSSSMKSLFDRISYDYKLNGSYTNVKCQISNAQGDGNEVTYDFRCDDVRLNTQSQGFSFYFTPTFFNSLSISSSLTIVEVGNNAALEKGLDDIKQEQEKTNEKLDETNDLISGDSENTEDKSCGIICKLKGIFTGIIELPMKLVNLLIDALKSLFVPTDEQLYEIINDSKELSENFGFVGESINFFITIFTSLLGMVNANGCIELPEFTIGATSLFDSFTFWHAQNVCLNDNVILSNNINTIRTITSIVLVGLFINFASKQFFSILSKNESQNDQAQEILDRYK